MVRNVIFNWTGHLVFIIAGFILPRMLDRRLGQDLLGVWDFAWSLVSYFGIVGAGVSSSVNRYVARYRTTGDMRAVNGIVSSAVLLMTLSGVLVLGLTVTTSLLLPGLFGSRLGGNLREAQWVVFLLGISMGIETAFQPYNGVLTGCHRWGLQNIINSGWHAVTIAAMIAVLLMGGSLRIVSLTYVIGIALAYATRVLLAYHVCEGLRLRPSFVTREIVREQFVFGAKTLVPSVSDLLLNQVTSIMLVGYLGPSMLALYSRPRYMLHHVNTLIKKMGVVLVPASSALAAQGNMAEIRDLLIGSVRYSLHLLLPIVLVLVLYGGEIMQLWMGSRYANGAIPAILAAGSLVTIAQSPIWVILVGLNAHGRAGVAELVASLCSTGLVVLGLGLLKWGLVGVAVAVTVPLTIAYVVYLPFLICRRLDLHVRRYFLDVAAQPVAHVLPFALCLVISRIVFMGAPLRGLLFGGIIGSVLLGVTYYRYVLPDRIKGCAIRLVRMKGFVA